MGVNRRQPTELVVLARAIRNLLPPTCSAFIAIPEHSALVYLLGVRDPSLLGLSTWQRPKLFERTTPSPSSNWK
jgi:ABC-type amino acid transport system permease subunit